MAVKPTQTRRGHRITPEAAHPLNRVLAEETPVALVYDGSTQAVMMATPEAIEDFAYGFSLTEGIITARDQIEHFEIQSHRVGSEMALEARFWLREDRRTALSARRRFMAGPVGCGLCGIDSLDQAQRDLPPLPPDDLILSAEDIASANAALRAHQPLHDATHAVHAAGFLMPGKGIVMAREDVGRHNALDKLIGALWRAGISPGSGSIVLTSRLSIELIQKAVMAGCPALIALSAPTAAALRLAERSGLTLAAYARATGFDVFSHPERIVSEVFNVA